MKMDENGWKWLKMVGMAKHFCKWLDGLKITKHCHPRLSMAVYSYGYIAGNGWKWLDNAVND